MKQFFLFCLVLMSCNTENNKLPILSYTIDDGVKRIYSITYSGQFRNQENEKFTNEIVSNKVFIANFFFTRCPSICPPMRRQLMDIADRIDDEDFVIVSHTIDPSYDTPEALHKYAESTGVPSSKWHFLTGNEKVTKDQADKYKTNFNPNEDGTDFYHSSYAALVDQNGLIRGFYDLLKPREVELLISDINVLLD